MSDARTIQFRLVMGKGDERVAGPDDADTVATIAKADATMDLSVAFMKSKLKILPLIILILCFKQLALGKKYIFNYQ